MGKLLENKNSLPFEKQKHCKLQLHEIEDIQKRYNRGEKISSIAKDYPKVSHTAIKYWAFSREQDLERRKSYPSVHTQSYDKNYYKDLSNRRKDSNLLPNIEHLSEENKEKIINLYETLDFTIEDIANLLNIKQTLVQSCLQSVKYLDRYKKAIQEKKKKENMEIIIIHKLISDNTPLDDICKHTGYPIRYIKLIKTVSKNPQKYINSSYPSAKKIAKIFLSNI